MLVIDWLSEKTVRFGCVGLGRNAATGPSVMANLRKEYGFMS